MTMEGALDLSSLLRLLSQAEQQAGQLMAEVDDAAENQYRRTALLKQIRSCLEEAISTAKIMEPEPSHRPPQLPLSDSPPMSNSSSPRNESSERVVFKEHERREMCKKRCAPACCCNDRHVAVRSSLIKFSLCFQKNSTEMDETSLRRRRRARGGVGRRI